MYSSEPSKYNSLSRSNIPSTQQKRMALSMGHQTGGGSMGHQMGARMHNKQTNRDASRMEIPAELAYVYSKMDEWEPPHTERHLVTTVGHVITDSDHAHKLTDDIDAYAFNKYASVYFNKDMTMYVRKEPIKSAFLPKPSHYDNKEAVAVFKLILRFMNSDQMSGKEEQTLGAYIVQKALSNPCLRDEVFVQLCNQLYANTDLEATQRGWLLMGVCLCGFPPSDTLSKYLLKFVSDQGYTGYKAFCQHKLLQCMDMPTHAARVYPPAMLEWKACRKKAGLALEVTFCDEETVQGEVESWTTAERFAANLLAARNIDEDTCGWTVVLREEGDVYAAGGHDYVLDLISELEVAPAFPYSKSYYLVSLEGRESGKRQQYKDGPHTQDAARLMSLDVPELLTPVPVPPRPPLRPDAFFLYSSLPPESVGGESWYQTREEMLSSSRLNQRPDRNLPILRDLAQTKLNLRYTANKQAPPPPGVTDSQPANQRADKPANQRAPSSQDFSGPKSPRRQSEESKVRVLPSKPPANVHLKSRSPEPGPRSDMSSPRSPLTVTEIPERERNNKYSKQIIVDPSRIPMGPQTGLPNGHLPNGGVGKYPNGLPQHSPPHSESNGFSDTGTTNIEQWLDHVFDPVLDADTHSDAQSLSHRLKGRRRRKQEVSRWLEDVFDSVLEGGGEGTPGQGEEGGFYPTHVGHGGLSPAQTLERRMKGGGETDRQAQPQQAAVAGGLVTSLPLVAPTQYTAVTSPLYANPPPPQIIAPAPARVQIAPMPTVSMVPGYSNQYTQNQVLHMEIQQQENLKLRLASQQLENAVLQEKLQSEILKQQIQQIEGSVVPGQAVSVAAPVVQPAPPPVRPPPTRVAPPTTHHPPPPTHTPPPPAPSSARSSATLSSEDELDTSQGEVDKSRPGGVKTLLRGYEHKAKPPVTPGLYEKPKNQAILKNREIKRRSGSPEPAPRQSSVKFSETVEQIPTKQAKEPKPPTPPQPPPAPPITPPVAPPTPPQPPVTPPQVPPPAPEAQSVETEGGEEKPGRRQGVDTVVKIGRVTWPPPQKEVEKEERDVGKLEIDERQRRVQETLRGRLSAHKTVQDKIDASKAANQKPVQKRPSLKRWDQKDLVPINMKAKREELEKQLVAIQNKQEDATQTVPEQHTVATETEMEVQTQTEEGAFTEPPGDGYLVPASLRAPVQEVQVVPRGEKRDVITQTEPTGESRAPPPPPSPPPVTPTPPPPPTFQDREVETESMEQEEVPPIDLPMSSSEEDEAEESVDLKALEQVKTRLFPPSQGPYYTYVRVPWQLEVRKEVFTPTEKVESPALVDLIFAQIVQDVFAETCLRIGKEDKLRMKSMLESQGVTPRTLLNTPHRLTLKRQVIDSAREWPFYFSRLYAVNGGRAYPGVHYTGVSHSGVSLVARETDLYDDQLKLMQFLRYEDIVDVSVPRPSTLQLHLATDDYIMLYTPQAEKISSMIEAYCIELEKENMCVRAVKDYHVRDSTLLHFKAGDVIKLTNKDRMLDRGWLYGSLQGRVGMFPEEYVIPIPRHEPPKQEPPRQEPPKKEAPRKGLPRHDAPVIESVQAVEDDRLSVVSVVTGTEDASLSKYPMLEFAMLYFRDSPYKYEMVRGPDGSIHGTFRRISTLKARNHGDKAVTKEEWQQQLQMIKWTSSPIQASLLRFDSELNKKALENFVGVMRFMGDYPLENGMSMTGLIDQLLLMCKNQPELRDEVYCQLAKQTCHNKSAKKSSNPHGWRLLSVLTAFFDCSDQLKPYLIRYLEESAYDTSREYHLIAEQCLQNLRHTLKYGGRKNTPDKQELLALKNGRTLKHISCLLSGGVAVIITVKSCTVVSECIEQVCSELDIQSDLERQEYTLFWVIEGEHRFCPLANEEYIIDVTTELNRMQSQYYLLFQRTSWVFPLHLGSNNLYVDCMYHQIRPEYDEGNFFYVPDGKLLNYKKDEIVVITAFLYLISHPDHRGTPQQKAVRDLLPRLVEKMSDTGGGKWAGLVTDKLNTMATMSPDEAKARFLDVLTRWPFFGSTFFNIKGAKGAGVSCDEALLAINRQGVHLLEKKSHRVLQTYLYEHLLTSRRHTDDKGRIYLDLKHGDLRSHEITTLETDHATAINTLISQYFKILRSFKAEYEDTTLPKRHVTVGNDDMATSF